MNWKTVSGTMLALLLVGMLALAFNIQSVKASGTTYIRADGSVDACMQKLVFIPLVPLLLLMIYIFLSDDEPFKWDYL